MSKADILRFLRDPLDFAKDAVDADLWTAAYRDLAEPLNAAQPLRPAQITAWHGLADARAGLILGPPGTGKTHALAWMAAAYLEMRRRAGLPCRILVSAFTRNAIINLTEAIAKRCQLFETATRVVFAGREPSAPLANGVETCPVDDAAALLVQPYAVVGTTIWGLNRLLKGQGADTGAYFHLTCIDEASQMVLSHGLMAIAGMAPAGRVLVAGDNKQLPPIRIEHNHDFDGRRLGSSLYAFLQAAGVPEFPFDETFRLNEPLTRFPRERFYADGYRSAVPEHRLDLVEGWQTGLEDWERAALDPEYPLCVLIHDGPPSGSSNPFEAAIAARLGRALFKRLPPTAASASDADKWQHRLAIVSPHRAQNALIRNKLDQGPEGEGMVVETVDRIQGRERDALLVSYTVADPEFALAEAEFIFSPERLNVTVTRARSKLILIVSRRLLEVVPSDEELVDKAEALREFIAQTDYVDTIKLSAADLGRVNVDLCVLRFDAEAELPRIEPAMLPKQQDLEELAPGHQRMLAEIVKLAAQSKWRTVAAYRIAKLMRRSPEEIFADLRLLQRHGLVTLERVEVQKPFWSIKPLEHPRALYPVGDANFRDRVEEVLMQHGNGRRGAKYAVVRDAFDWLGPQGEDLFQPNLDALEEQKAVCYTVLDGKLFVSRPRPEQTDESATALPPLVQLAAGDWVLLNHLEDLEARRINFGVFEEWHAPIDLARAFGASLNDVAGALQRLSQHGHVLVAEEGRVRSRMAEMARAVRYVKQRFRKDDAADRPYLVRGLKVEVRNRQKPGYDTPLADTVAVIRGRLADDPVAIEAIEAVAAMLRAAWGSADPALAGFQARALSDIFTAWVKGGDQRFVIAADTGAGKTEAACLPLIGGALADRLRGISGTRAHLVYPRVRLAANQSQRLARYLAALAQVDGAPLLTLGLQSAAVPEDWITASPEVWEPTGRAHEFIFPFFMCPKPTCGASLHIIAGGGEQGADRLRCRQCDWSYAGWIGTKEGLRATPPSLFLPTTESLHQWLNDDRYSALFGDGALGPRAILADEIHLYTHIQGAQIGFALRRLLARAAMNGPAPIAVGMSATLGRPASAWQQLVGGAHPDLIEPVDTERRPNPKGREYFYFVQPEVESRNRDVAGASTTIQSVMALAHNMRRRQGEEGGYRGIVFIDSIDKLKRLHGNYTDAEEGQGLASLRTRLYPDHPATGLPRRECCGQPHGCDLFRDGECWIFAAIDRRQSTARGPYIAGNPLHVAEVPVYSGSSARIESVIQRSDLVFSTASLEVGYDDPDMAFVYQHYAPTNLASFIQRKGRGGRGNDDRPITGVTLSIYSPRDSWYFRRPQALLDAKGFDVPLNLSNPIVVRGQLASLLLDLVARRQRLEQAALDCAGLPVPELIEEFATVCTSVFDSDPFLRLGYGDAARYVADVVERFGGIDPTGFAKARRAALSWVPKTLFGAAVLPMIDFVAPVHGGEPRHESEDIALGLAAAAPGNVTRRWGKTEAHWRAPKPGRVPFLSAAEQARAIALDLGSAESLLADLPIDAREDLGDAAVAAQVVQPTYLELDAIGVVRGGVWTALVEWDGQNAAPRPIPDNVVSTSEIDIRSTGSLRGFPIVRTDREAASVMVARHAGLFPAIGLFVGDSKRSTGLKLARLFWGADSEVRVVEQADAIGVSQIFSDPSGEHGQFVGYALESEAIRFDLDSARIDAFIDATLGTLADRPGAARWYRGQMLRYIVQRRARNAGINGYEARRAAELVVAAADNPALADELDALVEMWSDTALADLFRQTYRLALGSHPLLSERRIDRLVATLARSSFHDLLRHALRAYRSDDALRAFLRSQLVHSLAVRLRQSAVRWGRGDERRLLIHVRLPIQFGKRASDSITIVENGEGGDGTTRTLAEHLGAALDEFSSLAGSCPNSQEDALLECAHAACDKHQAWLALDPRRPETLAQIGEDLGIDFTQADSASPQQLLRLLYTQESIGGEVFALYDVWREVLSARDALAARLGRDPDGWEIVSAAVADAREAKLPRLAAMLTAYGGIEQAASDGSLSPEQRLADQIHRLSGRLCYDGCLACLHGDSDLMPTALAEVAVSRRLLADYLASLTAS